VTNRPTPRFRVSRGEPSYERYPGKCAGIKKGIARVAAEGERHLAGRGNGENICAARFHLLRLRALGAGGVKIDGPAFPGGAVDHGLAIGSEAGGEHDTAAEGEGMVSGERRFDGALQQECADGEAGQ
jgi:hypothetical protein